ncbi:glycosyltransferase family 39 protein [Candidatus Pacearchaeota archaeon]|nr:glycosyltransferase family 39 protein [Candidatus Pacearchaeota archaeon]
MKKAEIIILVIILLFALFLRIYALGSPGMWIDESISGIASREILEKGIPVFDSGSLYSRAYVFHYLQASFMFLIDNDFGARLASVIFGLLIIVLGYFIGKEYSKSGGLIAALFLAVFYLEVFYSRQARFYQMFQFMFFLTLYLVYKSKEDKDFIYPALLSFFITVNTQVAGLVIAPFFIIYSFMYNKQRWWLSLFSLVPFVYYVLPLLGLSGGTQSAGNYVSWYSGYTNNIKYLLILFIPGVVWSYIKNKKLTLLLVVPTLTLLFGVFFVKLFALRYMYFFVFALVFYSSILIAYLYDKYGSYMILSIFILLLFPSNLLFDYTFVNVIKPVDYNLRDASAPVIDYKAIPLNLSSEIINSNKTIMTFFSPGVEWYLKKPDYVFPFSMNGIGNDTISYNGTDVYSGAVIKTDKPDGDFYFIADNFALSKLSPSQRQQYNVIVQNCSKVYDARDLGVYEC